MEHLVAGCKQGNRKAQEALYKQLSTKMMGVCIRYAANRTDAEDILQMGFVKMFQKIKNLIMSGVSLSLMM